MCYYKPMVKKGQILSNFRTNHEWFLIWYRINGHLHLQDQEQCSHVHSNDHRGLL